MSTTQDDKVQKAPELPNQHTQMHTIRWLLEKLDDIHDVLCPGQFGTWQQRAEQAVEAAKRISKEKT
jgi:hypothetical protein